MLVELFAQMFQIHHVVAAGLCCEKVYLHRARIVFGTINFFHAIQCFLSAFCGNDISLAIPLSLFCNVRLLATNLFLLIEIVLCLHGAVFFKPLSKCGVIAVVVLFPDTVKNVQRDIGYFIQKITVVRDHDQCFWIRFQIFFQPFCCFHIQMVGGLVQQQYIRFFQQQSNECKSRFLSPTQCFHRFFPCILWKAHMCQHGFCSADEC